MICPVCGHNKWTFERRYNRLDKYEKWCGIPEPICRAWWRCDACGLRKAKHSYDTSQLLPIYVNGYRASTFRGGDIQQEFYRIIELPTEESENRKRVSWVNRFIRPTDSVLDVGAGLGVFLYELKVLDENKFAIEPNKDSAQFLNNALGIECKKTFYMPQLFHRKFDWVACLHVLEHVVHPEEMLLSFHYDLNIGGRIYVEVPDAREFEYLEHDNDEFNSTHLHFFTPPSLCKLVESCGYRVTDMKMITTNARNLSRIMLVADAIN